MKLTLNDNERLKLITEAVLYCQKVKAMGMPASAYTKALREPVHFLWERRGGTKSQSAQFRSMSAVGMEIGDGTLVYDHSVPFNYLQKELLALAKPTAKTVGEVLNRFGTIALITKEEDDQLNSYGLNRKMPDDWDGIDPFARYKAVGTSL